MPMAETESLPAELSRADFDARQAELRIELLALQRDIEAEGLAVVVVIAGIEGAGKGAVVHRLNEWLDTRGVETRAFWDTSDEQQARPHYWRFWQALPAVGRIAILFGSWYTQTIIDRVYRRSKKEAFADQVQRICEFERLLCDDSTLIVKLWFEVDAELQQARLKEEVREGIQQAPEARQFARRYDRFVKVSEETLEVTDTEHAPWYRIDSTHPRHRDLLAGYRLRDAMRARLEAGNRAASGPTVDEPLPPPGEPEETLLGQVELTRTIKRGRYEKELADLQRRLGRLSWEARERNVSSVLVFEGADAAGKGGAIRRLTGAMDPRLYQVIPVSAPTDEERAHHYLWRFWRHVPRDGMATIYDRSWYGRVLVERVEGFATVADWRRAYREIREFEIELTDHGTVLLKFWLHISPDEQLSRFRERETTPWKQHKLTDEDWRNRDKWPQYVAAAHDMITETSTERAPWFIVPSEDKKVARLAVLKHTIDALEARLDSAS